MSSMFTGGERVQPVQAELAPSCPRCTSANTKFCYYNNYSLTQPRYFCKGCRRYWTKGGSLRNVPVGGGCRKSRRSRSRAHASQRNSANQTGYLNHGDGGDSATDSSSSSGAEIDMAAVFARYVSQPVSEGKCEGEGLQLSAVDQFDQDAQLDLESFDYEMLLADDMLWSTTSEDGSSLSSNVTGWEPMAALEELDSTPIAFAPVMDEQFSSPSGNLLVDNNWSCVDLSGFGDFYRP